MDAKAIIGKIAYLHVPDEHAAAKTLVKAKKWTDDAKRNFLLAVAAENPAEIKRTYAKMGCELSEFIKKECLPQEHGGYVVHPFYCSPFALIRNAKIAKLVLSLDKKTVAIRVNWHCMTPEMLQILKEDGVSIPENLIDENIDTMSATLLESLLKSGVKPGKDASVKLLIRMLMLFAK